MNKTKTIVIITAFLVLAGLWLKSTTWFRLQLADYYQEHGSKHKAVQIYEKVLRKNGIETENLLCLKEEFMPKNPKDFLYIYFIQGKTEELIDLILDSGNKDLLDRLPENYLKSPLYRYYYAISLAKKNRWEEAENTLKSLSEEYPYLSIFQDSLEAVQKKWAPKAEFDIVGIWKFDKRNDNIAEDLSGRGNHGKNHGAKIVKGINGKALKFDGINDYIEVARSDSLKLKDFTFSVWIKPLALHEGFIIRNGRESGYIMVTDDGHLSTGFNDGSRWHSISQGSYKTNEWKFIVLVFDKGVLKFYQDGKLAENPHDSQSTLAVSSNNLFIGKREDDLQYFNGIIDEIQIFNRALSAKEIKELYQQYFSTLTRNNENL